VISRGTCHLQVAGHTKNEYKEDVKSRVTLKNYHFNFHLWIVFMGCHLFFTLQANMSLGTHKVPKVHRRVGVLVKKAELLLAYLHPSRTPFSWVKGI